MTEKAFQELVFCYRDTMYRFAKALLRNDSEAEDSVQVVMIKMWQQKERLACVGELKSYLLRSLKNECLNKMQRQQVIVKHQALAGAQQPVTAYTSEGNMTRIIHRFLDTLPPKQKQVMLLRDVEELETADIATLLDMEETAVRTNLARARQKVRDYLKKIDTYEQQQIQ